MPPPPKTTFHLRAYSDVDQLFDDGLMRDELQKCVDNGTMIYAQDPRDAPDPVALSRNGTVIRAIKEGRWKVEGRDTNVHHDEPRCDLEEDDGVWDTQIGAVTYDHDEFPPLPENSQVPAIPQDTTSPREKLQPMIDRGAEPCVGPTSSLLVGVPTYAQVAGIIPPKLPQDSTPLTPLRTQSSATDDPPFTEVLAKRKKKKKKKKRGFLASIMCRGNSASPSSSSSAGSRSARNSSSASGSDGDLSPRSNSGSSASNSASSPHQGDSSASSRTMDDISMSSIGNSANHSVGQDF
jgi:hypothetical protein